MKPFFRFTTLAMFAAFCINAQASGPKEPYIQDGTDARQMLKQAPIHWVSIEQIKESIKDQPKMNVSFDIDDTVAFTSGCFHYGKTKYSPDDFSYLKNQAFWDEINAGCDKYSVPKEVAKDLIKMHQERGDQVFLITGRTAGKDDQVTSIMEKALGIKNMQPVNFMGGKERTTKYDKTPAIIEHKISIHYGDSDDDILAAKEAGIRGIRVMRSDSSNYQPMPRLGGYGEEVIINSSY